MNFIEVDFEDTGDYDDCEECVVLDWDYTNNIVLFNVSHFTSYKASDGTHLEIWDDTNDPQGALEVRYPDEDVKFYANYTNSTGGAINGTGVFCNISFNHTGSWSQPSERAP